jgi:hypothetical protein
MVQRVSGRIKSVTPSRDMRSGLTPLGPTSSRSYGVDGLTATYTRRTFRQVKGSAKPVIHEVSPCGRLARALQPASPIPATG